MLAFSAILCLPQPACCGPFVKQAVNMPSNLNKSTVLLDCGSATTVIDEHELHEHVESLAGRVFDNHLQRVLLVPPDHTRLHSRAGQITTQLFERLTTAGVTVAVMPALGTHEAMTPAQCDLLFGAGAIPNRHIEHHRWRDDLVELGEISAEEVAGWTGGQFAKAVPVAVNKTLLEDDWDLVISIGQVVPHEVAGMANFTKNIAIGLGGSGLIHISHFLSAICNMETVMGRVDTPVRSLLNCAFDRFIAPHVNVLFVLTVMESTASGIVQRGLYAAAGSSADAAGIAFAAAGELAGQVNITRLDAPLQRCACWLHPDEFHSTWLGNKAIYRTRMAIHDDGELLVLAPQVSKFGEDAEIDALIRKHGYRGTKNTLAAVEADAALAGNLAAAAHLIHGSSEGRFTITYCTNPATGGLGRAAIESVGYRWRLLPEVLDELGVNEDTPTGPQVAADGNDLFFVANPGLGLLAGARSLTVVRMHFMRRQFRIGPPEFEHGSRATAYGLRSLAANWPTAPDRRFESLAPDARIPPPRKTPNEEWALTPNPSWPCL